jgi:hypothetical protein
MKGPVNRSLQINEGSDRFDLEAVVQLVLQPQDHVLALVVLHLALHLYICSVNKRFTPLKVFRDPA